MNDLFFKTFPLPDETDDSFPMGNWSTFENEINLTLPIDYKYLISTFGSGQFFSFITLFNPASRNKNINLFSQIFLQSDVYKTIKDSSEIVNYELFPTKGCILPIGATDNGDCIFFLTTGEPNSWKIIINEARGDLWEEFDTTITQFLIGMANGSIESNVFPELSKEPPFFSRGS